MSNLFKKIKDNFFTKSFIMFCIIGVINTIINSLVMKGSLFAFDFFIEDDISTSQTGILYFVSMGVSTLLAFLIASICSYFLNATFTYKQKERDTKTFFEAFLIFALRFVLTYIFTLLIWEALIHIFGIGQDESGWWRTLSNFIASILMIPPFYIIFGLVFKRTKERLSNTKKEEKENGEN